MHLPSAEWVVSQVFRFLFSWYQRRGKVKRLEAEAAECKQALVYTRLILIALCVGFGIWILYASRNGMTRA